MCVLRGRFFVKNPERAKVSDEDTNNRAAAQSVALFRPAGKDESNEEEEETSTKKMNFDSPGKHTNKSKK